MKKKELSIESIEKCFEITQGLSKDNIGHNFRCPCCDANRIAKARVSDNDWYHTGCACTYNYLSTHKLLVEQ